MCGANKCSWVRWSPTVPGESSVHASGKCDHSLVQVAWGDILIRSI